jgi:putative N6-adenine-specific DNA methylase
MIDVSCRDFFTLSPGERSEGKKGVVALNPPYGRRLGSRHGSRNLFQAICTHLLRTYPGWKIALVAPEPEWVSDVPFPLARLSFRHGGLAPVLLTGSVP